MPIHGTAVVHPSAMIEEGAVIGPDCLIGAYAIIGAEVTLAARVTVKPHAIVTGWTAIGEETTIWPFACVGEVPQDLKYKGERTRLEVGARCRIRENVTINAGTEAGGGVTRIGDDCLLMAGAHVAHDVQVGNRVVLVNQSGIAGHAQVGDDVILGGISGIHQFVRVGRGAIIGALTMVPSDVIPYGLVQAARGELEGLNLVGLKRRGVARAEITQLRAAYQMLAQGEGNFQERAARLGEDFDSPRVHEISEFIRGASERSFLIPKGAK